MEKVDPVGVFEAVKEWKQRPTKWKLFVRDLLVVLTRLRPVVFLDGIVFRESSSLTHFLSSFSLRYGIQLTVLKYSDKEAELQTNGFCVFIADWEQFEARRVEEGVFLPVEEGSAKVSDAEEEEVRERMESLTRQISQRVQEGQRCIDLSGIGERNDLPTLTGYLLGYPVIYCISSTKDHAVTVDCVVCRLILRCIDLSLSDELFSFTVPFELRELQRVKETVKAWKTCWERKAFNSRLIWQGLEFQEERCCTHVLHF